MSEEHDKSFNYVNDIEREKKYVHEKYRKWWDHFHDKNCSKSEVIEKNVANLRGQIKYIREKVQSFIGKSRFHKDQYFIGGNGNKEMRTR